MSYRFTAAADTMQVNYLELLSAAIFDEQEASLCPIMRLQPWRVVGLLLSAVRTSSAALLHGVQYGSQQQMRPVSCLQMT